MTRRPLTAPDVAAVLAAVAHEPFLAVDLPLDRIPEGAPREWVALVGFWPALVTGFKRPGEPTWLFAMSPAEFDRLLIISRRPEVPARIREALAGDVDLTLLRHIEYQATSTAVAVAAAGHAMALRLIADADPVTSPAAHALALAAHATGAAA